MVCLIHEIFLTIDGYNVDERLESSVLSTILSIGRAKYRLMYIVMAQTFTLGGYRLVCTLIHGSLLCKFFFFFACLIFAVGLNREIILTAKFPDLQ